MTDTAKKKLTPFQRFVGAIARVPKEEADKIAEAERKEQADKKRKSA